MFVEPSVKKIGFATEAIALGGPEGGDGSVESGGESL